MTLRHAAALTGSAILVFGLLAVAILFALRVHPSQDTSLIGVVLTDDTDPRKQMPLPKVRIIGRSGATIGEGKSDSIGFFRLTLHPGVRPDRVITLSFSHPDFRPLSFDVVAGDQIHVARMAPLVIEQQQKSGAPELSLSDVSIRYTVKMTSTIDQGTIVKTFSAVNGGNVPCHGRLPCSPDGRWKAATGSLHLDAPEEGRFRDVRVSCIAGPCPFTKIESDNRTDGDRKLFVSAVDWSSTATFLVEADVVHTVASDMVRRSYPVIFGRGMNFTLPGTAAGPSIEAELNSSSRPNGSPIVFPLGPELILSWATCTVTADPDQAKLYSCELKPGYRFQ